MRKRFIRVLLVGWLLGSSAAAAFLFGLAYSIGGWWPVHPLPLVGMSMIYGAVRGLEAAGRDHAERSRGLPLSWNLIKLRRLFTQPPGDA